MPFVDKRPLSPCAAQTETEIDTYYRKVPPGSAAAVRQTQRGWLQYTMGLVERIDPNLGWVYVPPFGAFYMKNGKYCFHPTGQTTLVVPTAGVINWKRDHPRGEPGYRFSGN